MSKRTALIVGINNYGSPDMNLGGCVNDATLLSRVIIANYGFDDVRTLLNSQATLLNISTTLKSMVEDLRPGDHLLFYFSGHGTQVPDKNSDESDGLDECIVTHDHDWDNPFTDDILRKCLKGHPQGANITVVVDACHSGTITDDSRGKTYKVPDGLLDGKADAPVNLFGVKQSNPGTQRHVLLASSSEKDYSYEGVFGGRRQGLMTGIFLNLIRNKKFSSFNWYQLRRRIYNRVFRRSRRRQTPVVTGPMKLLNKKPFA